MDDQQKVKELFLKYKDEHIVMSPMSAAFDVSIEMSKWKEEQMVEKAIKWLDEHFDTNIYEEIGGRKAAEILTYDFKSFASMLEDFKQAMKGE